ncbi:MAG: hypothetical protein HOV66_27485 [Streptomycetaceae bacterium]|jgi:hypothetical protein|uniref:S1 motif domain-containing protein n=1 Tax=Yinghuangia aomiensis TaxID=676205 RepID=A0ABP9GRS0_9ACTN|nr:hypothetical protein [Streptomycetaceae bacterium]NUS58564.1 hypothetical protein [Streptomycetaceae bacterium]
MVGLRGKVTGRIGPGLVGEVMVGVRGGIEAFLAYPVTPDETFEVGQLVTVVEYQAPRTVYVQSAFG